MSPFQHIPILCFLFQNLQDSDFSQNSHQCLAAMDTAGINFLRQAELTLLWENPVLPGYLKCSMEFPTITDNLFVCHIPHNTRGKKQSTSIELNQLGFQILLLVTQAHVLSLVIFISRIKTYIGIKT